MDKITQLAEQGKEKAYDLQHNVKRTRTSDLLIYWSQAPLIEYCKELEEFINKQDEFYKSNIRMQNYKIEQLKKENQELKDKLVRIEKKLFILTGCSFIGYDENKILQSLRNSDSKGLKKKNGKDLLSERKKTKRDKKC